MNRLRLAVSIASLVTVSALIGWWAGQHGPGIETSAAGGAPELPAAETLVSPDATVEMASPLQFIPGGPLELAVISDLGQDPACAVLSQTPSNPAMAPRRWLQVFAYDPAARGWGAVLHSAEWPASNPLVEDHQWKAATVVGSFTDAIAGRAPCLAIRDVTMNVVAMRPDRDFLAVVTFSGIGLGTGTGRVSLLGFIDGAPSLLYQEAYVGGVTAEVAASSLVTRASLYLFSNANCCASGYQQTTLTWDEDANRLVPGVPVAQPHCNEGMITRIQTVSELFILTEGGSPPRPSPGITTRYVDIACLRDFPRGRFETRTTYTFAIAADIAVGDTVRINTWSTSLLPSDLSLYVTRGRHPGAPTALWVKDYVKLP